MSNSITTPDRDLSKVKPVMARKALAVCADVNAHPEVKKSGLELRIFEGYRSPARQAWCIARGVSKVKNPFTGPHQRRIAVDVVWWDTKKLVWTWTAPRIKGGNGWDLVDASAQAHNLRRIRPKFTGKTFDDPPHLELKKEDW